jgi:dolichol-phosphate mannosyltransferase
MLRKIKTGQLDAVVGTRNADGGSMGEFAQRRVRLSDAGRVLSRSIIKADISDPMSGFFLLTRSFFEEVLPHLSAVGFKILIDIIASSRRPSAWPRSATVFSHAANGESKLDLLVGLELGQLLLDKHFGDYLPTTFVLFGMVGTFGVFANFFLVRIQMNFGMKIHGRSAHRELPRGLRELCVNNSLTFRSRRLRGRSFWLGLTVFYLACGFAVTAGLYIADHLIRSAVPVSASAALALAISGIWNYWMSSLFV